MAHEISRINNKMRRGEPITKEEEDKLRFKSNLKKDISRDEKMENLMGLLFDEEEFNIGINNSQIISIDQIDLSVDKILTLVLKLSNNEEMNYSYDDLKISQKII